MPQGQPIQHMNSIDALQALSPLRSFAVAKLRMKKDQEQTLIDALSHLDDQVIIAALKIIREIPNKTPYAAKLISLANDHHINPTLAKESFNAMQLARDISPFHQVIDSGSQSLDSDVANESLLVIHSEIILRKPLSEPLKNTLNNALKHADDKVKIFVMKSILQMPDKTMFANNLALLTITSTPQVANYAGQILRLMSTPQTKTQAPPPLLPLLKGVRLNFNIEANGGGEQLHPHDAVAEIGKTFKHASENKIRALVFYDPSEQIDGQEITVIVPKDHQEKILAKTLQGYAPEFDIQQQQDGSYKATLKDGPKF